MGRLVERSVLAAAAVVVAGATLPPLLAVGFDLAGASGVAATLTSARAGVLLFQSVRIAALVTTLSCFIGVPLGILIGRFDVIGRKALWAIHGFPMFVPPFLLALGWFHVLGGASGGLFSEAGVIAVLVLALAPIVTSLVAMAASAVDGSLEDAARVYAGPWRVATRVLLPACRPAIGLSGVIVFALAFSELGVPMFLRTSAYPVYVLSRLGGVDYAPGEAAALAMPLVLVTLLVFAVERRMSSTRVVMGLRSLARSPIPLDRRAAVSIAAWMIALGGVVPLVGLLVRARFGAASPWLGDAPRNSLVAAGVAASVITIAGFVVAHAIAGERRGARALEGIAALAFVLPPSVLGVGLIGTWNRGPTQIVYGTIAIVAVGFVARYAVLGIRACTRAIASVPIHLDESARVFGASFWARMTRVVLPASARGVAGAWLLCFVFSLRDLETPVLFYPPGSEPLTVRIFTLEANGAPGVVAALAIIQMALTAVALGAGASLLRERNRE